jgi:hypothetical protein
MNYLNNDALEPRSGKGAATPPRAGRHRSRTHGLAAALALILLMKFATAAEEREVLVLDDRETGDYRSSLGSVWRLVTDGVMGGRSSGALSLDVVTDGVMGGRSSGALSLDEVDGRPCLRLRGSVSLENNGGFVQAALDLTRAGQLDGCWYTGVQLEVYGNGETYNVHLRTGDTWLPWQAYRASFRAPRHWTTVQLPFTDFAPHRIDGPLDLSRLRRLGIVAIGREFDADVCVAGLALYRAP